MSDNSRKNFYSKKNWRNRYWKQNKKKELNKDESSLIVHDVQKFVKSETIQCSLNTFINTTGQYNGWKFYFPNEEYKKDSVLNTSVTAIEEFIVRNHNFFNIESIEERRACVYDIKTFLDDDLFMKKWPSFKNDLINSPSRTLNCLGLSIHKTVCNDVKNRMSFNSGQLCTVTFDVPPIKARVINNEEITQLKNLKTGCYGNLVSIIGTVIRVGNAKLQCSWMAFECIHCGYIQCVKQPDGAYCLPSKCSAPHCQYKTFTPLRSSQFTQTYDWQSIQLQELAPDDQREGGRVPRTIECELTDDLVSSCTPGDIITVTGIVKVKNTENIMYKKGKAPSMFLLYVEVVSIVNNKNLDCSTPNDTLSTAQFTQNDYSAIREIHSEPFLFKLLVNSICPTIYGHEMVKAGLILSLFGGSQSDNIGSRGHIHLLMVGDPGLGKSQMLQACSYIVPRGVFVCGNATTSSGLTVTLTREGGGDYALEAGALVMADQGCCCIDEFDKMTSQHQALLEVMEQQTVSIAKAGVICTLPARTTVLAAANPVGGHYNKGKTVSENLRLGQALLSRFDLVFILLDQPNEYMDNLLSEHVMALHSGIKNSSVTSFVDNSLPVSNIKQPISERLKIHNGETMDLLPAQLLRKYIAYAKKYVPHPVLSEEANKIIQNFYLELRKKHQTQDSTPVTTRQLLSLIRLTQARAKLELREEATGADALDVVELMRWSLVNTFSDEFGILDFQRSQHGSGMSSKNQAKKFISILHKQTEIRSQSIFSMNEMKQIAKAANIQVADFFSFISTLNNQGFLLKKNRNEYQVLSVE